MLQEPAPHSPLCFSHMPRLWPPGMNCPLSWWPPDKPGPARLLLSPLPLLLPTRSGHVAHKVADSAALEHSGVWGKERRSILPPNPGSST